MFATVKVISTNLGSVTTVEWQGGEVQTGIFKTPVNRPVHLGNTGVEGDHIANLKAHGGFDKACYLYGSAQYEFWKKRFPDADWDWGIFGENLTVDGLDESLVNIGNIYRIGSVLVQISQPRIPCYKLGIRFGNQKIVGEFLHQPFPGAYVRIIGEGEVKTGDELFLIENRPGINLAEVFSLLTSQRNNSALLQKALDHPDLAPAMKKELQRTAGLQNV